MSKKRSIIWTIQKDVLQELFDNSNSFVEVLIKLNLNGYSGNHRTLNERIKIDNLDLSKLKVNRKNLIKNINKKKSLSLDSILIENSKYKNNSNLKTRLLESKILKYECSICKNNGYWLNKPVTLQLDHINGVSNDNQLKNLRLLCPNCHSQTDTFSGRNAQKINLCKLCNNKYPGYGKICKNCFNSKRKTKIKWPKLDTLLKICKKQPLTKVALEIGCSDNAIRKHLQKNNINLKNIK
jgi:5-methylcytosine-specific restriction endonuclease McrA